MKALGFDVGGTFVDLVLFDSETARTWVAKRSSGDDPAAAVVEGIDEVCALAGTSPVELDLLVHGTTIATNAILQYEGARTGLITTKGFRDVLHIGRHQRPQNYSIQQDIPWQARPLVRRRHRLCVAERLAPPDGRVITPLDLDEVRAAALALAAQGVEAVAVCFLFSYLDPAHEEQAAAVVRDVMPDAFVCTSSDVVPQFREFERFTTAAINAFVGPVVARYVRRLEERLGASGASGRLHLMQSNGGTASPEQAVSRPATLLLSGPVGGVVGGIWAAGERRRRYLATIDVGGTSADIGIVTEEGLVEARARETWIAGYPVLVPMIDVHTIGAGGGSIAYVDAAGAPHVGPRSAGAVPGPASYGRGGSEPTVTDAHVVLGHLPGTLAGGLELDAGLASRAVARFAEAIGVPVDEAAAGILAIVDDTMAAALRLKTVERGLDPRQFALCAFGGAGPLHGAALARLLEIPEVVIPPGPGVTSAAGLLASGLRYDVIRSVLRPIGELDPGTLAAVYQSEEAALAGRLERDGCPAERSELRWAADLRYRGQGYELTVPVSRGELDGASLAALRGAFDTAHREEFGHDFPAYVVELVNLRVTGLGRLVELAHPAAAGGSLERALVEQRDAAFALDGRLAWQRTPVYRRELLPVDEPIDGPAVVVQLDATTLVPPRTSLLRMADDTLRITV